MMKKSSLARSIGDAGWGEIVRQVSYKAQWYGKTLVQIDRWFPTSKRCNTCGTVRDSLPLNIRRWTCEVCGAEHGRDENAAKNILAVGHTVSASGDLGKSVVAIELHGSGL